MAKTHTYMPDDCKELCKALTSVSDRYSTWQVFEDWLKISSISISNTVDLQFRDEREKEYFEIIKKYNKDELNRLADCLGIPAVVIHGNSLTVEQWSVWRTPAYILGFWESKTKHIGNSYMTEPVQAEETKKETVTEDDSETNNVPPKFDIEYSVNRNGQMSLF